MQNTLIRQGLEKGNSCKMIPAASKKLESQGRSLIKQDVTTCDWFSPPSSLYFFTKERTLL